ncbi:hypothetical protein QAD02_001696, partial [Eretmocerus hayati]
AISAASACSIVAMIPTTPRSNIGGTKKSQPFTTTIKPKTKSRQQQISQNSTSREKQRQSSLGHQENSRVLVCPNEPPTNLARLFGVACKRGADCNFLGSDLRCCKGICRKGVEAPVYEPPHAAVFGIRRKCPALTFPDNLPIKRCSKDEDCEGFGRICCPDKKDNRLYCRTAAPLWTDLPSMEDRNALNSLLGFIQCQAAPPRIIDIFTKPCNRTIDCLPNLCCQEGSQKFCRPPKSSILNIAAVCILVSHLSDFVCESQLIS